MTAQWVRSTLTEEDATGIPYVGATVAFFNAGTTTPRTVYSDAALTNPILSPALITNSSGRWPQVFVQNGTYKYRMTLPDGAVIEWDNVDPGIAPDINGRITESQLPGGTFAAFRSAGGIAAQADLSATNVQLAQAQSDIVDANTAILARLPLVGGTMTGPIVLPGDATLALQAVPKQQLDSAVSGALAVKFLESRTITAGDAECIFDTTIAQALADGFNEFEFSVDWIYPSASGDILFQGAQNTSSWITSGHLGIITTGLSGTAFYGAADAAGVTLNDPVNAAREVPAAQADAFGGIVRAQATGGTWKTATVVGTLKDEAGSLTHVSGSAKIASTTDLVRFRFLAGSGTLGGGRIRVRAIR